MMLNPKLNIVSRTGYYFTGPTSVHKADNQEMTTPSPHTFSTERKNFYLYDIAAQHLPRYTYPWNAFFSWYKADRR